MILTTQAKVRKTKDPVVGENQHKNAWKSNDEMRSVGKRERDESDGVWQCEREQKNVG
jgi:hypothetical protein